LIRGEAPRRIGRYIVEQTLGKGGHGIVHLAWDSQLRRFVAIKLLLGSLEAGSERWRRFQIEAEIAARLRHENVVQVYEVGVHQTDADEPQPFVVMEYVKGGSLASWWNRKPQPPAVAVPLLESLARAVHYAHQQGILHRDLKPGNVLLASVDTTAPRGTLGADATPPADVVPKISDFGLAKDVTGSLDLTRTGDIVGTPSYMSPEQAQGLSKNVGPATDIWALGVMLYEAFTGRPPFQGVMPLDTLLEVIHREPVPPRQLQPKVPRDLETICLKCLCKEPGQRYASAHELAEDLRRFQAGEPIRARPVGVFERGWRWAARNPVVAALLTLVVLSLTAGTGVASYFAYEADQRAQQESLARHAETLAKNDVVEKERQRTVQLDRAERMLYLRSIKAAQQSRRDAQIVGAIQELQQCRADLRHWEWHYLRRLCQGTPLIIHGPIAADCDVVWSADGRTIACPCTDRTVRLWEAVTGRLLRTFPGPGQGLTCVVLSPDGRRAATVSDLVGITLWDTTTGERLKTLTGHGQLVASLDFSPDGQRLVSGGTDATVRVWDVAEGRELFSVNEGGPVSAVKFSPDGRRLLSAGVAAIFRVRDAVTGQELLFNGPQWGNGIDAAFSPDGRMIATTALDGRVQLWNAFNGQAYMPLTAPTIRRGHIRFSPDGRFLAVSADDGVIRLWEIGRPEPVRTYLGHEGPVGGLAFSPDGLRLVSAGDQTLRIWDVANSPEATELSGHQMYIHGVALSPDKTRPLVATSSIDGTVRLWDLDAGREAKLMSTGLEVFSLAFSPDGHRLAGTARGSLIVRNVADGEVVFQVPIQEGINSVVYSPDGTLLAAANGDGGVKLLEADKGLQRRIWEPGGGMVRALAFSPDSSVLAAANTDGTISLLALTTEQPPIVLRGHGPMVTGLKFSPKFHDDHLLVSSGLDQSIRLWDCRAHKEKLTLRGHTEGVNRVAFSPDGKRLASAGSDATLRVWDLAGGPETLTLRVPIGAVSDCVFTADGRRLISVGYDAKVRIWDASPLPEERVLSGHTVVLRRVVFSPNNQHLASLDFNNQLRLWDVRRALDFKTEVPGKTLRGPREGMCSMDFSPDSQRLIGACWNGTLSVWETSSRGSEAIRNINVGGLDFGFPLAIGSDPRRVFVRGGPGVRTFDLSTGQETSTPEMPIILASQQLMALSSDGQMRAWSRGAELIVSSNVETEIDKARRQRFMEFDALRHRDAAELAERTGHLYAAAFHVERMMHGQPHQAETQQRLFRLWSMMQEWSRLAPALDKAVAAAPDDAELRFQQSVVQNMIANANGVRAAREALLRLALKTPPDDRATMLAGRACVMASGGLPEAETLDKLRPRLDPVTLGALLCRLKQNDEAAKLLEQYPNDARAVIFLALTECQRGRLDRARELMQKAFMVRSPQMTWAENVEFFKVVQEVNSLMVPLAMEKL
jgi:WD40 repeat protein/tetratricopeptide (TPR) repeat protein/predicted Ser/Thr protein kinase